MIFGVILLADTCLTLAQGILPLFGREEGVPESTKSVMTYFRMAGVLCFFGAQVLIIKRNMARGNIKNNLVNRYNIIAGLILLAISATWVIVVLWGILGPIMAEQNILLSFAFGVVYVLLVTISLWTAFCSFSIGHFPKRNSLLATLGLFFFYLGDLFVTFSLSGEQKWSGVSDSLQNLGLNLIWMVYTPALLLLALSVKKYKEG